MDSKIYLSIVKCLYLDPRHSSDWPYRKGRRFEKQIFSLLHVHGDERVPLINEQRLDRRLEGGARVNVNVSDHQ